MIHRDQGPIHPGGRWLTHETKRVKVSHLLSSEKRVHCFEIIPGERLNHRDDTRGGCAIGNLGEQAQPRRRFDLVDRRALASGRRL